MNIKVTLSGAAFILTAGISVHALAQEKRQLAAGYPSKPIRVMTTVAAGGGLDIITRAVATRLGDGLAYPVVVDNVAGAGGAIAINTAIKSAPDGHTIVSAGLSLPVNTALQKFDGDVKSALTLVAQMSSQPYVIYVSGSSRFNSLKELLAYAKANPAKLSYGSSGVGSGNHMGMKLLEYMANVEMLHVPYKGNSQANIDLVGGRIDVMLGLIVVQQMARAGQAKIFGVATLQRMPDFPDLPTIAEQGVPGYELSNTYGLYVAGKTPANIVAGLNRGVIQALADPALRQKMLADTSTPAPPRTPEELKRIHVADIERWEAVVKKGNIKLDE